MSSVTNIISLLASVQQALNRVQAEAFRELEQGNITPIQFSDLHSTVERGVGIVQQVITGTVTHPASFTDPQIAILISQGAHNINKTVSALPQQVDDIPRFVSNFSAWVARLPGTGTTPPPDFP
jgi:hypothetical protein